MSKITNLIGTTWRLGGDIQSLPAEYGIFNVLANGTYDIYQDGVIVEGQSIIVSSNYFYCGYSYNTKLAVDGMAYIVLENPPTEQNNLPICQFVNTNIDFVYEFTITGGEDISNPLFIDFINTYGTLVSGGEPPTAEGVKEKLQSLLTASNAKTGKSDANLTDAVKTLLEGYGSGEGIFAEEENEHGTTVVLGADLQEKTIDITANGTVEVTPDEGYALKKVTAKVNVGGVNKLQWLIDARGTDLGELFQKLTVESVEELEGIDTSNATSMSDMFSKCSKLTTVPLFDTSNVASINNMFYNCRKLTTVPSFDTRNATTMSYIVAYCQALTECWIRNIRVNLQVGDGSSWGHLLTLESLLHLCKECRKTTSSLTLTMGTANLAKLEGIYVKLIDITDDMRAEDDLIDEKYPFVQCASTDEGAMTIQDYMATKKWSLA